MPNNWKTYKLSDIADITSSKRIFLADYVDKGIPFYRSKEIIERANGLEISSNLFIDEDKYFDIKKKFGAPKNGDLLISAVGERAGIPYCVNDDGEFYFKDGNLIWCKNFKEEICSKFLYYFIRTEIGINLLESTMIGSAQRALTIVGLKNIQVNFPPIQEQKSIASILSAIDDKIENNLAINKTLEEMAMALYKHWFVDFGPFQDGEFVDSELGRIPKGWEVLTLKDVSNLTAGGDKPKNFSNVITEECKIPIYSNGITNDGLYGFTDTARINEESITVSARGTIGFVCLRLEPYLPIVRLIAVVPNKKFVSSKYLFYWLKSQNINGNGTTQQQLTVPDFRVTKVMVPKLEFVNKFTDIINPYYDAINSNIIENQTLTQLRDTLLPKLISGEVRLKEFREESITN